MARARFNGVIIAESDDIEVVEGNPYFPASALKREYFVENDRTSVCGWKGTANYYDVVVNGQTAAAAAWYYADPKSAADNIKGRIAFWGQVEVEP